MRTIIQHTVVVNSTPQKVWAAFIDYKSWPQWDTQIQWVSLEGDFVVGAVGKMKSKGNMPVPFRITAMEVGRSYTSVSGYEWMKLIAEHRLEPRNDGTVVVTFALKADGPLSMLLDLFYGRMMREGLPKWMENFRRQF